MTADRISRRAFLRSITAGGASLISIGPALARGALWCARAAAARPVEWALLSDTHISADPDKILHGGKPRERLQRILDDVLTCRDTLSGVVINGDLAVLKGLPGDYVALFDLLAPLRKAKLPVYLLLGNHDDRTPMQHVFGENPGDAPPVEGHRTCVVDSGPVRLVMLDSLIRPNYTPGRLGEVQLRWLMHRLDEASDRPCILFLHHTLSFDGKSLEDDAQLGRLPGPQPCLPFSQGGRDPHRRAAAGRMRLRSISTCRLGARSLRCPRLRAGVTRGRWKQGVARAKAAITMATGRCTRHGSRWPPGCCIHHGCDLLTRVHDVCPALALRGI